MRDSCGLRTSVKLFDFGLCCRRMGCDKLEVYLYLTSRRETQGGRERERYKQTVRHCTDRLLWLPDRPRLILMAGRNPICPLSLEFRENTNTTVLIPSILPVVRLVFTAMPSIRGVLLLCTDINSSPSTTRIRPNTQFIIIKIFLHESNI